jgi:hypothetical protein
MSTCCNCIFHAFQMNVAYILSGCCKSRSSIVYVAMTVHVCCKCMFQIFQLFKTYVASVLSRCCICCTNCTRKCCICCTCYTRMLQVYVSNISVVSNACCKCFIWMLHILKAYVVNVLSILDVCCSKCFMLQVFHQHARLGGAGRGCPLGHSSPVVHVGSQASTTVGAEHKAISMGMAACVENEAYIHARLPSLFLF